MFRIPEIGGLICEFLRHLGIKPPNLSAPMSIETSNNIKQVIKYHFNLKLKSR